MKHVLGPHISYRAVEEICSIGKRLSKKINSNKLHEIMFSKNFRDREKDTFELSGTKLKSSPEIHGGWDWKEAIVGRENSMSKEAENHRVTI